MRLRAGFELELPPELKAQSQVRNGIYSGDNRLLKDDPVWTVNHPGFSMARKIQCGEEFCFEICVMGVRQAVELFWVSNKPLFMIMLVIEGNLKWIASGSNPIQLGKGQSWIAPIPSGRHKWRLRAGNHVCFYGYVKLDRFKKRVTVDPSVRLDQSKISKRPEVFSAVKLKKRVLQFLYNTKRAGDQRAFGGSSLDIQLWDLLRYAIKESGEIKQKENLGARQVVYQIKDYLDDRALNRQTLSSIAELAIRFYVHPQHLSRVFKSEFGISLRDYITGLKMKVGYALLIDEKLPVHIVAFELGYKDPYSFGRQFRTYFGFSPGTLLKPDADANRKM